VDQCSDCEGCFLISCFNRAITAGDVVDGVLLGGRTISNWIYEKLVESCIIYPREGAA